MSKSEGKKIVIKFSEDIVGDVGAKTIKTFASPKGLYSASNTVGGYPLENAFDGNPNTFWYNYWGGNTQWLQVKLPSPTTITGFRWSNIAGYRPKGFKLQGSINGSTWVDILTGESANLNDWQVFELVTAQTYEYYRWTFLSYHSSYVQLSELELQVLGGNEFAFLVTGQEYKYVQGLNYNSELINKQYKPISVEKHPTVDKAILLQFSNLERFNSVVGNIKVEYDALVGNLSGRGGRVESFTVNFTPTDLISTPNPGVTEIITVAPTEIVGVLNEVDILSRYTTETITVAPVEVIGILTNIDEINP